MAWIGVFGFLSLAVALAVWFYFKGRGAQDAVSGGFLSLMLAGAVSALIILLINDVIMPHFIEDKWRLSGAHDIIPISNDDYIRLVHDDYWDEDFLEYQIDHGPYNKVYRVREEWTDFITGDQPQVKIEKAYSDSIWWFGSDARRYTFTVPED